MEKDQISNLLLHLAQDRCVAPNIYNYSLFKESRRARRGSEMMMRLTGHRPFLDKEYADRMSMLLWEGDDLCNRALISMQKQGLNPHEVIECLLVKGIEGLDNPTIEMKNFWEDISIVPDWVDWDKLERGARIYRMYGAEGFQFQGVMTINSYRNEFIAKTLMYTGRYTDHTAFKRYLLTCNFWMEISEIGGMKMYNEGWKVALRVRMLHTLIRQSILASGRWDIEKLGMPINYVGMLGAPLISSLVMPYSMRILGYMVKEKDINDTMHLWRYVHYLMGGDDKMFPRNPKEGVQAVFTSLAMAPDSDDEGVIKLGESFIQSFKPDENIFRNKERQEKKKEYEINLAHSFFFVPRETRKLINMPNTFLPMLKYMLLNYPRNKRMSKKRLVSKEFSDFWDKTITKKRREWVMNNLEERKLEYRSVK